VSVNFNTATAGSYTATILGSYVTTDGATSNSLNGQVMIQVNVVPISLISVIQGSNGNLFWSNYAISWSGWTSLAGSSPSTPALCAGATGTGRVDLVVRGTNNGIAHKAFTNGAFSVIWDGPPGGTTMNSPACASLSNVLYVAATGVDGFTYVTSRPFSTATWAAWTNLGNPAPGSTGTGAFVPTLVATPAAGRVDILVRGADNGIYHKALISGSWSATWDTPNVLTFNQTPDLIASVSDSNHLHVVVRGMDNQIYYDNYTFSTNSWQAGGWLYLKGGTGNAPSLAIDSTGKLHLAVQGLDNHPWYASKPSGSSWTSWSVSTGGNTASAPAIAANGSVPTVLVRGSDNAVYVATIAGSTWSTWTSLGGQTGSSPTLIALP
jgi:hypothetical protein